MLQACPSDHGAMSNLRAFCVDRWFGPGRSPYPTDFAYVGGHIDHVDRGLRREDGCTHGRQQGVGQCGWHSGISEDIRILDGPAPVGRLGRKTFPISTAALNGDDATYARLEATLAQLTDARNAIAHKMIDMLEGAGSTTSRSIGRRRNISSTRQKHWCLDSLAQEQGPPAERRGRGAVRAHDHAFASASRFRKAASPTSDTSTHFRSGEASAA